MVRHQQDIKDRTIPLGSISLWASGWHSWHLNGEKKVPLGQENQRVGSDLKCEYYCQVTRVECVNWTSRAVVCSLYKDNVGIYSLII